jgi:hypothetical protein
VAVAPGWKGGWRWAAPAARTVSVAYARMVLGWWTWALGLLDHVATFLWWRDRAYIFSTGVNFMFLHFSSVFVIYIYIYIYIYIISLNEISSSLSFLEDLDSYFLMCVD